MNRPPPAECAVCGDAIPRAARACPGCGADERTGWRDSDATRYDGLDLPDSAYEDDAPAGPLRRGLAWYWVVTAAVALLAAIGFALGRF
jgi:hypothetical protein